MGYHGLQSLDSLEPGRLYRHEIGSLPLLLVKTESGLHIVEDRCGHFGISMAEGSLQGDTLVCQVHGIAFSLKTGEIVNRPWEVCDPIKVYRTIFRDEAVGVEL